MGRRPTDANGGSAVHTILVLGAGKIGSLIACLLHDCERYSAHLADVRTGAAHAVARRHGLSRLAPSEMDATDSPALADYLGRYGIDAVVSGLPYYCNAAVAATARECGVHYFDLTEDITVAEQVRATSQGADTAFVPQCGLAPGFISIAANDVMSRFQEIDTVKMRVGALPLHPSNALKYYLTWSTDGLINEYGNMCQGIENGELIRLLPLEGREVISLDGVEYEAFNTSGGLGTLAQTYAGRARTMNYRTLRYPGHCEKIRFLMNELKLNDDRATLKHVLERAIPKTVQDVVLIYVAVNGMRDGEFFEESYVKKVYPQSIAGSMWSSIQVCTAAAACSVLDIVLSNPQAFRGFVTQESFQLSAVLGNEFGRLYEGDPRSEPEPATRYARIVRS